MASDNLKAAGRLDCVDQVKSSVNHKTASFSLFALFDRHITVLYAEKKTQKTCASLFSQHQEVKNSDNEYNQVQS